MYIRCSDPAEPRSRGLGNEPLEALQDDGHAPCEFATGWEVASEEVLVCSTPVRQCAIAFSFGERVTLRDIVQVGHCDVRETEQCSRATLSVAHDGEFAHRWERFGFGLVVSLIARGFGN